MAIVRQRLVSRRRLADSTAAEIALTARDLRRLPRSGTKQWKAR